MTEAAAPQVDKESLAVEKFPWDRETENSNRQDFERDSAVTPEEVEDVEELELEEFESTKKYVMHETNLFEHIGYAVGCLTVSYLLIDDCMIQCIPKRARTFVSYGLKFRSAYHLYAATRSDVRGEEDHHHLEDFGKGVVKGGLEQALLGGLIVLAFETFNSGFQVER